MVQENEYFIIIMCLAPVLTFFVSAILLSVLKESGLN